MTWRNLDAAADEAREAFLDVVAADLPEQTRAMLRLCKLPDEVQEEWREFARRVLRAADTPPAEP